MFKIKITDLARAGIERAFAWWSENRSKDQAKRWYEQIKLAVATLKRMPDRCPTVPEKKLSVTGVRQLLFGTGKRPTHSIIFVIESDVVAILRVRHHGQDALELIDIDG